MMSSDDTNRQAARCRHGHFVAAILNLPITKYPNPILTSEAGYCEAAAVADAEADGFISPHAELLWLEDETTDVVLWPELEAQR